MPEFTPIGNIDPFQDRVTISTDEYERLKGIEARTRKHADSDPLRMTKVSILANQILWGTDEQKEK